MLVLVVKRADVLYAGPNAAASFLLTRLVLRGYLDLPREGIIIGLRHAHHISFLGEQMFRTRLRLYLILQPVPNCFSVHVSTGRPQVSEVQMMSAASSKIEDIKSKSTQGQASVSGRYGGFSGKASASFGKATSTGRVEVRN